MEIFQTQTKQHANNPRHLFSNCLNMQLINQEYDQIPQPLNKDRHAKYYDDTNQQSRQYGQTKIMDIIPLIFYESQLKFITEKCIASSYELIQESSNSQHDLHIGNNNCNKYIEKYIIVEDDFSPTFDVYPVIKTDRANKYCILKGLLDFLNATEYISKFKYTSHYDSFKRDIQLNKNNTLFQHDWLKNDNMQYQTQYFASYQSSYQQKYHIPQKYSQLFCLKFNNQYVYQHYLLLLNYEHYKQLCPYRIFTIQHKRRSKSQRPMFKQVPCDMDTLEAQSVLIYESNLISEHQLSQYTKTLSLSLSSEQLSIDTGNIHRNHQNITKGPPQNIKNYECIKKMNLNIQKPKTIQNKKSKNLIGESDLSISNVSVFSESQNINQYQDIIDQESKIQQPLNIDLDNIPSQHNELNMDIQFRTEQHQSKQNIQQQNNIINPGLQVQQSIIQNYFVGDNIHITHVGQQKQDSNSSKSDWSIITN